MSEKIEGATSTMPKNDERRIWIGNLDPRISEYHLLKLLQKCGPIEKFDMLFHKGGPLVGQSRGYAFATFATNEAASNALLKLNGTQVGNRAIAIRLAKNVNYDELDRPRARLEIPALGTGKREGKISKEEAIRAIEAKLKALEQSETEDLQITAGDEEPTPQVPFIQRYQFNKDRDSAANNKRPYSKPTYRPYNRQQRPKHR